MAEKIYRTEQAELLCRRAAELGLLGIQKEIADKTSSWEEAVKALEFSLKESNFFTRDGLIENIGIAPEFSQAVFSRAVGEISGVVKIPNGFAVLKIEEEEPFSEEKYEEEKEGFRERTLKQKQNEYYSEWFETLRTEANLTSNVELPEESPPQE